MHMRKLTSLVFLFLMMVSTPALPSVPAPRKSPEFLISNPSNPSGRTTPLSTLKGRVVVLEFFFVQSEHCMRVAKTLNKLNGELGPRGFQAIGIVFDPPKVPDSGGGLIQPMVDYLKLTYPVGFATKTEVDTYLGRTGTQTLSIPQMVVIDRSGFIRAATGPRTDPGLEDENSLRNLLEGLLKESPPAQTGKSRP